VRTYTVDGASITDIASLCEAFARAVGAPIGSWGESLVAFDDRLFGGFGLVAPCEIIWEHSGLSRAHLDSEALVRYCERGLETGNHEDDDRRRWFLDTKAKAEKGERTLFDEVLAGISSVSARAPGPGWTVDLVLR
jgi:hypothetical protein